MMIIAIIAAGFILYNTDKLPVGVYVTGLILCGMAMAGSAQW